MKFLPQSRGAAGPVLGVVGCAATGLADLRAELVDPFVAAGWTVGVTLTPTAYTWLHATGEIAHLRTATGLPVRSAPRLPGQVSPHPRAGVYVAAPASAASVAKLALGIGDNQALTQLCEALGTGVPVVVFPRVNAAHARHPAWQGHLATLRGAGVHVLHGEDVWPLQEPREQPERSLPWPTIRAAIGTAVARPTCAPSTPGAE